MGRKSHRETTALYKKLQDATEKCSTSSKTIAVSVAVHRYTVSDTNFTLHSAGYLPT
jgi:hypothetical protein